MPDFKGMEALKDTLLTRELKSLEQNNNTKKHSRPKIGKFGLDVLKSAPKRTFTGVFLQRAPTGQNNNL